MKKLILLLLILLTSCSTVNKNYKKDKTFLGYISDSNDEMVLLLNTEVYLTTVNEDLKDTIVNKSIEQLKKYHILLDSHHKYYDDNHNIITNISVLNESIGKGPINVDPIIIDAIKEAITITSLTNGYFNFTIGELSKLYKDKFLPYDSNNTDPSQKDIDNSLKGIIPFDKINEFIILDEINNTIELKENEYPYSIDLGAFSKGYIIDKVYEELVKYDTSFLLNAGTSSIVSYSSDKENIDWTIAIQNPDNLNEQLLVFSLNNGSISTSGDYENYYFLDDGTRRHHILNPYTGYSENYYRTNTLVSSNAGVIDALSTALFNINDNKEFNNILNNIETYYNIDISFLYIEDGLNIFMDRKFSESINNTVPSTITYTSTILE